MKDYDGKLVKAGGQNWLILRQLQPAGLSYHYEVYLWDPPRVIIQGTRNRGAKPALLNIAQSLGTQYPTNPSTDQIGNILWESI